MTIFLLLLFHTCVNVVCAQIWTPNVTGSSPAISPPEGNTDIYDRYFGEKLTERRRNALLAANASPLCTAAIRKCDPKEPRRIDGSCTNPHYPSRGVINTPYLRMLPHNYGSGNTLRPATDGSELPSARKIRQEITPTGQRFSKEFSHLLLHFIVGVVVDFTSLQDSLFYNLVSECCIGGKRERNFASPRCISIPVPEDDPYLANSDVRCLNLTRQQTFQDILCIPQTLPADRINLETPVLDLSAIYGPSEVVAQTTRQYQGGLLREEVRQGRVLPPGRSPLCSNNQPQQGETSCYEMGDSIAANLVIPSTLFLIWFYKNHNFIARNLFKVNPCWDDEKLFRVARDINIAHQNHIYYYEANSLILGRKNALKARVIFDTHDYVDDFDEHLKPGTYLEYVSGLRYFHENQDGRLRLYSPDGKILREDSHSVLTARSGYLEVNRTLEEATQGAFRQPAGESDKEQDYAFTSRAFGSRQEVADLPAIDIMRNRDNGHAPYNHYRRICGLHKAHYFSDFEDVMDRELVIKLSEIYNDVDDVDLSAGINAERLLPGTWVGPTLHCIITHQLLRWRRSDIYWYEHSHQPTPFTLDQLNEIRKMTVARLLCNNGEEVTEIQKAGFLKISHKNPLVSCSKILEMDYKAWADPQCKPTNTEFK